MKKVEMREAKIRWLEKFFSEYRGYEGDRRKKGTYAVFSYFTNDGIEYRRGYWFPKGTKENGIFDKVPNVIKVPIE